MIYDVACRPFGSEPPGRPGCRLAGTMSLNKREPAFASTSRCDVNGWPICIVGPVFVSYRQLAWIPSSALRPPCRPTTLVYAVHPVAGTGLRHGHFIRVPRCRPPPAAASNREPSGWPLPYPPSLGGLGTWAARASETQAPTPSDPTLPAKNKHTHTPRCVIAQIR
jgi:hypothetical protein